MGRTVRIVSTPDVLHGKPRVEGTRIGVLQIGELVRRAGWSVEEVTEQFDLDRAEARAALDHYDDHPALIDTLRAQRRAGLRAIRSGSRVG